MHPRSALGARIWTAAGVSTLGDGMREVAIGRTIDAARAQSPE